MKKLYIGIGILFGLFNMVDAMVDEVRFSFSSEILKKQLHQKGFDFLLDKKTKFIEELTEQGKKHDADTILLAVENAYTAYGNHINNPTMLAALKQNKPRLFELILEDLPDILKEIKVRENKALKEETDCK